VLVATADQLTSALALIELDGLARRLVLCPPDFPPEHFPFLIESAAIDAIVSDEVGPRCDTGRLRHVLTCRPKIEASRYDRAALCPTEWILLTSGTTGIPKLVSHTLASLTGAIEPGIEPASSVVWSTFYDIRRYGGLQIFLRAILGGSTIVLGGVQESTAEFLVRAGKHGVSHISGTPSHWRRALMSPSVGEISPRYIRLSGEIADQAILNHLHSSYPNARISHAFASTEAGVGFDVTDGLAGFPSSFIGKRGDVELKVVDASLRIRSNRVAGRYLGNGRNSMTDADGFVDTGDIVELRGDRYYFAGRRDGVINVGGLKVHPEEVEAVINRHPHVRMSLVRAKKSSITGAIVIADIVLYSKEDKGPGVQQDILSFCRDQLPSHKVPAMINFVPGLAVGETGKISRRNA
jgi:acyl-coenzyme A synthetase/AMP-(fatty) acid ligase